MSPSRKDSLCKDLVLSSLLHQYIEKHKGIEHEVTEEEASILNQAKIDTGDLELFDYAIQRQKSNTQPMNQLNNYLIYLTDGKVSNELIFNFSR